MSRIYASLLRLYPRDFRAAFTSEMSAAFQCAAEDRRAQGSLALIGFALKELAGLLVGAAAEWIAKLTTDSSVRGRTLPDLLLMRPAGVSWQDHYRHPFPDELAQAQQRVDFLVSRIVYAIAHHDFERARSYSCKESQAREKLRVLQKKYNIGDAS